MRVMSEDESIVLKPREPFSDAILPQNADELAKFMDQPMAAIAETITGALAAGPKAWSVMTGHIVQGILKGKLFQQVSREIKELREKGKIPDDFADEKKYKYGFKSWVELLTIIDEDTPDADRLEALKAMFYGVNKINATDRERILSYQLFQIAKELTSSELLVLKAIYELYRNGDYQQDQNRAISLTGWAAKVSDRLGYVATALVLRDEQVLAEQGLISPRIGSRDFRESQQSVVEFNARLTDFGIRFCQNIETYHLESRGTIQS